MSAVTYENVTFIKDPILKQKKEEFIASHMNAFWRDRDEETRRKMLGEAYDLISKKNVKAKK